MRYPLRKAMNILDKNKRKVGLYVLAYLVAGYVLVLGLYLLASPGYLMPCPDYVAPYKCTTIMDLVRNTAVTKVFWIQVLIWPFSLITLLFAH